MAENNNSNPPNDQHADDQHEGAENAQQALDDLTVLQNVQNQNMGDARLNVARAVDVSDTQLGNLANVQQGSTGSPQVQNLGGIAGGANIAIEVEIEAAKGGSVTPPGLESLAADVRDEAPAIVVNPGGAKPLNVRELPDLARPDAEFKDPAAVPSQPVTLTPPGGFVANALAQDAVAEAPAEAPAEKEAPEIQAAVNQAPTLAADDLVTANDDDAVSGFARGLDPDGDNLTYSLVGAGADGRLDTGYGYVTIDPATGQYTFTPDDRADSLAAGDERLLNFTVSVSDGEHASTAMVNLDLNGSNDLASISGDASGMVAEDGHSLSVSGTLDVSDADTGESLMRAATVSIDEGTFSVDENGRWSFSLNNDSADIQALGAGDTLTRTFTVTSADGSATQNVTVTIAGSNDGPFVSDTVVLAGGDEDNSITITRDQLLANAYDVDGGDLVISNLNATNGTIVDNQDGTYTFTPNANFHGEVDFGYTISDGQGGTVAGTAKFDVASVNDGPTTANVTLGGGVEDQSVIIKASDLLSNAADIDGGTLSISDLSAANGTIADNGDGTYTFTPTADFNGRVELNYTIEDGQGGSTPGTATFDVASVNDAAVITGDASGAVGEDGTLVTGGDLDATDIDSAATFMAGSQSDAYGTFAVDADGQWTYTLDNTAEAVQALGADDRLTRTFEVQTADGTTRTVSVTIDGANDAAVITGDASGAVGEDGTLVTSGDLDATDIDSAATFMAGTQSDAYGTFAVDADGQWTYTLDNTAEAVQALGADDRLTRTFEVQTADGTTRTVSVTIDGANDAAVITGDASGAVGEDGTLVTGGDLDATDIDSAATFMAGSQSDAYGTFAVDADGQWTYTLDNTAEAVQALGADDRLTRTFEVQTADGTTRTVSVTIDGANDAAVITGDASGAVGEDGTLVTSGDLDATDIDSAATFMAGTQSDAYGTFAVDADGQWTYTLDNTAEAVQALGADDRLTRTFEVQTADGTTRTVSVTIDGANDAAVITGDASGAVGEDGTLVTSGDLDATDIDSAATFMAGTQSDAYGTFAVDADGQWTYTLDNTAEAVQALGADDRLTRTFEVQTADGTTRTVSVTIDGANDAAVITGDASGAVGEDGTLVTSGDLDATDIDSAATFMAGTQSDAYGTFAVDADGQWTYTLDNTAEAVQALGADDRLTRTFEVQTADGTTRTVSVTIDGANDAAVITGDASGAVGEDGTLVTSGDLDATDIDSAATFMAGTQSDAYGTFAVDADGQWTYTLDNTAEAVQALGADDRLTRTFEVQTADGTTRTVSVTIDGANDAAVITGDASGAVGEDGTLVTGGDLDATDIDSAATFMAGTQSDAYGTFAVDADGQWTYTLDNTAEAVQALGADDRLTRTFEVQTADGTTRTVSVTIDGANDAAVITGDASGAVGEDGTLVTGGDLDATDIDSAATFMAGTQSDAYGTFAVDADGQWTYTLDNTAEAVQALGADDRLTRTFEVQTADGTTRTVSVTIDGANDAAVITGDASGAVGEDGTLVTSGDLDATDIDSAATFMAGTQSDAYGTFAVDADGQWTYTLDNTAEAVQALGADDRLTRTFEVQTADGTTRTVSVTIDGANDAAVITGDASGAVGEDGTLVTSGDLDATDIDSAATFMAGTQSDAYGTFAVDADGQWTYTLDNTAEAVQALGADDRLTRTFEVQTADGTTRTVSVTIDGANDAAVITGDASGAVGEDGTLVTGGDLDATDIDSAATFMAGSQSDAYGTFAVDADGQWTYTLDNTAEAVQALGADDRLTRTFEVQTADGTTRTVSVTIDGANDAAVITGDASGAVGEDGTLVTGGDLDATDIDSAATFMAGSQSDAYGTFAVDADGQWTYTLDNTAEAVQALGADDRLTRTFEVQTADGTTRTVSVTIDGANDAAVITGDASGAVGEDGTLVTGGDLDATDIDSAATFMAGSQSDAYGTFAVDADGQWTYTLDNTAEAVQALGADDRLTRTFEVQTADGTTRTVSVTIDGANDAAVITGDASGAVGEDGTLVTSGDLDATDIDSAATFMAGSQSDAYGTFAVDADGQWTYTLDNTAEAVQALGADDRLTRTFEVQTADGTTRTVSVTIDGANDAAVITGDASGAVGEDGTLVTSGTLDVSDADSGEAKVQAATIQTDEGTFHVSEDGQWNFSLNNGNADVQALGVGESMTKTFTVTSADGTGTQEVTVTISGSNDGPVVSGAVDLGDTAEDNSITFTAQQLLGNASDIDGDALSVSNLSATNGTITQNADGTYTFTPNADYNGAVNVTYTVSDGHGGTTTGSATLDVTAVDDDSVITGDTTGSVTEDGSLVASGDLDATDGDRGGSHANNGHGNGDQNAPGNSGSNNNAENSGNSGQGNSGQGGHGNGNQGGNDQAPFVVSTQSDEHGTFTINAEGNWSYTLNNATEAVQSLGADDQLTKTFTVQTADGTTKDVTITVNGANDGPTTGEVSLAAGTEDRSVTIKASDLLSGASDVDGDTLTVSDLSATNGTITDNGDGTYTFTPTADYNGGVDLTYTISDGHGGTTQGSASFEVNAVNDAPEIVRASDVATDEDHAGTGRVAGSDIDAGDTVTYHLVDADGNQVDSLTTEHGSVTIDPATGEYTFTPNEAAQALGAGATQSDSFQVVASDGSASSVPTTIDVTIGGVNDQASISGQVSGSVGEDGTLSVTGTLSVSDVDAGEAKVQATSIQMDEGTFSIGADGNWTFDLNNGNADVQALGVGDSLTKTFTVTSADGTATQEVTVTITGSNDGPVVSGEVELAAGTEDRSVTIKASDLLSNASDVDGDTLTVSDLSATNGTITDNGDGTYTFTPTADYNGGVDLTYTISDGHGGTTQGSASFEVNAVNDAPEIVRASDVATDEDHAGTGRVAGSDIDAGDTVSYHLVDADGNQVDSLTTEHGSVTIDPATGEYTFTPNEAAQALGAGATQSDSFQVVASDGTMTSAPSTVGITITGSNDGAVITGATIGTVGEDGNGIASGTLNVADVDAGQNHVQAGSVQTDEGTFTIGENGQWTFQVNSANADVQALGVGESMTRTFAVASADGTATQNVTVTITGANDGPVVSGAVDLGDTAEDNSITFTKAQLLANASDVDGDTLSVSNLSAANGTISDNGDGTYTFTPTENFSGSVDVSYTVSDGHGGTTTGSASLDVSAVADQATVSLSIGEGTVNPGGSFTVTNNDASASAGYHNTYGYYVMDDDGNPVSGGIIWKDVHDTNGQSVTIEGVDPDRVGFFLIPNGDQNSSIRDGSAVTFSQDARGNWQASDGSGRVLTGDGAKVLFDNKDLNSDDRTHLQDRSDVTGNQNWEDLNGGGDNDFNDVNMSVSWNAAEPTSTHEINVAASFPDMDGSEGHTVVLSGLPAGATLSQNGVALVPGADGSYTLNASDLDGLSLTTAPGFTGEIELSLTATSVDGTSTASASAQAEVTLDLGNQGPDAGEAESVRTAINTSVSGQVEATDADGNELSFTLATGSEGAQHGTVALNPDGTFTYTPAGNYSGTDTFKVVVSDGHGGTTTETVTVTVENGAPTLTTSNAATADDHSAATGHVSAVDPNAGDTVSYHLVDADGNQVDSLATPHGTVTIDTATGDYTFTPSGTSSLGVGASATDSFKVVATDNHGANSNVGTVNVTVTGSNDGPVVTASDLVTGDDHSAVSGRAAGADVDAGDTVSYHLVDADGNRVDSLSTEHGTVSIDSATGEYTFTPGGESALGVGQTASDSFKVVAVDNHGAVSPADTVSVTITGSNDGPVVDLVSGGSGTEDNVVTGSVAARDVDSGDTLSYSLVDGSGNAVGSLSTEHGTVSINSATGEYTFTPNADWAGTDSFSVQVSDGHGGTVTQAVNVNVGAVADAPELSLQLGSGSVVTLPGASEDVTITAANMNSAGSGFSVSAVKLDGSAGTLSANRYGFGVSGNASGDSAELGQSGGRSEKISVNFDDDVSSADVSFGWLAPNEKAHYELYQDGVKVGEGTVSGLTDNVDPSISVAPANGGSFDQIVFSAPGGGDNDYMINSIRFETAEPGERVVNYPLDVSASLGDTDGSERLTVSLNGLPEGAVIMDADGNVVGTDGGNGTWSLPAGDLDGLVLQVPAGSEAFTLGATATATESDPNAAVATASTSLSVAVGPFNNGPVAGDDSRIDDVAQGPALAVDVGDTRDIAHTTTTTTTVSTGNDVTWDGLGAMSDPTTATPTTNVAGDLNNASNGGNSADAISIGGSNNASISTGNGDDQVTVGRNVNAKIDLGNGTNALDVGSDVNASVSGGSSNDAVRIGGNANQKIDLGNGDNQLQVGGDANANSQITTGSGNDDVKIGNNLNSVINLGSGDDDLHIGGNANASIDVGSGNDRVLVGQDLNSGKVDLGAGDDYLEVRDDAYASIDAGSGNDTVKIGGDISAKVDMGAGDDRVTITGDNLWATVTGGSGTDSIELTGVTKAEWDRNADGVRNYVKDFENIKFADGQVIGDASAFESTTTVTTTTTTHTYETPITVQATLNDTDGSETLSPVTIGNIPAGGHLELNGQALTPNADGTYTLNVSSGAPMTVTLVTDTPVTAGSLNLTTTVSSTEAHGGDVSVTTLVGEGSNAGETVADERIATGTDRSVSISSADLLANDSDADGDALSIISVGNAQHGTVSLDAEGQIVFTADRGFEGTTTFEYTVSDGHGGTDVATVSVYVDDPNDAPVIDAAHTTATLNVDYSHANTSNIGQVSATDMNGDTLTYSVLDGGNHHGNLVIDSDSGSFFYNADDTGWSGTDTFTVQVSDGEGGLATQTISVQVTGGSHGGVGSGGGQPIGWGNGGGRDESWGAGGSWSVGGSHSGGGRENNGWGDGNQDAPGGSGNHNNAENDRSGGGRGHSGGGSSGGGRRGNGGSGGGHSHGAWGHNSGGGNAGDVIYADDDGTNWGSGWRAVDVGNGDQDGTGDSFSITGYNRHNESYNGDGGDTLIGAGGNDYMSLEGADGKQHISGYDHIQLGNGDNAVLDMTTTRFDYGDLTVAGGTGHDVIWSAGGDDLLVAGNGGNTIHGGAGDDTIVAGAGSDVLMGQDGHDTFLFDFGTGHDTVNGGAGGNWTDTIDLSTNMGEGASITISTGGHDWTVASDGDHQADGAINLGQDKSGTITIHSQDGDQTIEFTNIESIKF